MSSGKAEIDHSTATLRDQLSLETQYECFFAIYNVDHILILSLHSFRLFKLPIFGSPNLPRHLSRHNAVHAKEVWEAASKIRGRVTGRGASQRF